MTSLHFAWLLGKVLLDLLYLTVQLFILALLVGILTGKVSITIKWVPNDS